MCSQSTLSNTYRSYLTCVLSITLYSEEEHGVKYAVKNVLAVSSDSKRLEGTVNGRNTERADSLTLFGIQGWPTDNLVVKACLLFP